MGNFMRLTSITSIRETWARWLAWPTIWVFTLITWYLLPDDSIHGFSWFAATHSADQPALLFFLFTNIVLLFFVRWETAPNITYFQNEKTRAAWQEASTAYSASMVVVAVIIYYLPFIHGWAIPNVALFSLLVMSFFSRWLWKIMDRFMDSLPAPKSPLSKNGYGTVRGNGLSGYDGEKDTNKN